MLRNIFTKEKEPLIFILVTMFLNFLGLSILFPIFPFMVEKYIINPNEVALYVGLLLSSYALCQFFAAPALGALSDRYGRKPILLISLLGSIIGYLILGIGGSIGMLFLGRIIDGLTGGNISTIYAYMADITEPKDRGKYFGMLGAAAGFGMMFGPAIGGFLGAIHLAAPLYIAAAVTLADLLFGYFVLPESLAAEHKTLKLDLVHLDPFRQFHHIFTTKILGRLFATGFIFFIAMNAMYANNSLFLKDVYNWNVTQIGMMLFFVGILDIFSQGYLIRKLLPIFGDVKVATAGLVMTIAGFALAVVSAIIASPVFIIISLVILNIGDGLFEPSQASLISTSAGPQMQGRVQGANQGMQSIARIVGPLIAAWLYRYWQGLPYTFETVFMIVSLILLLGSVSTIKAHKSHV